MTHTSSPAWGYSATGYDLAVDDLGKAYAMSPELAAALAVVAIALYVFTL